MTIILRRSPLVRVAGALALVVALVATITVGLSATPDRAAAQSTNLYDQMNDGAWVNSSSTTFLAQSFSTSTSAPFLTGVDIMFRNANASNSSSTGGNYTLELWSDGSSAPGSRLTDIKVNESVGAWAQGSPSFTLSSPYQLAASTRYWVVLKSTTATMGWKCNAAAPTTDVSPTPTFNSLVSSNSGSSWSAISGNCAAKNLNMKVAGAIPVAPTLGSFANVNATVGDTAQTITAPSANTAGSFSYSSSDTAVATVSGSTLAFAGAGTSTITALFTPTDTTNWTTASTTMTVTVASPPPSTTTSTTSTTTSTTSTTTTTVPGPSVPTASTTTTVAPAVVPAPTTTTSTTSTTVPAPPPGDFPAPAPIEPNDNIFGDSEGEQVAVVIDTRVGERAAGAPVRVSAVALQPGSPVIVTVFSEPTVLLRATADANGNYEGSATLPTLEPGRHTVLVESTGRNGEVQVAGALLLDDEGFVDRLAQPAVLTGFTGPDDPRLSRALTHDRPVWDVAARPLTTAAITVSAVGLLAFAGAAGLGGARSTAPAGGLATGDAGAAAAAAAAGSGDGERRRRSRARLASVVTKKLKGIQIESSHRGDASGTWGMPGTARTDGFSRSAPVRVGRWSAVLPRVLVDGAWARAMFGSFGFALWPVGVAVALLAAFTGGSTAVVPAFGLLLVMVVIGILDAGAGACAWLTLVIASVIGGQIEGWPDVRALMGLGILLSTISLLAHVIRPLRRYVATNRSETWERVFDYVMMPVFVAFAAGAMLKALNGLSGLQIVSTGQIADLRWVVYFTVIARLAVEDVAAHLYPERMRIVQPEKLASQTRAAGGAAIVVRSAVFLFIAEPFFGLTATTVIAAVLLALPGILKLWEDDLPNSATLNKWFPRGLFRFMCLTLLGMYLTAVLIGRDGGEAAVKSSFLWLLLPGVSEGVIELFGRHGGAWPNVMVKRTLGAVVWVTAVSLVTGLFTPFI